MKNIFKDDPSLVYEIRQGIERECLRTLANGHVSLKDHPRELGSKLTHAFITTDYSENLLEFITKVHSSTEDLLNELEVIHAYVQKNIGDELLWTSSMPPIIPKDNEIPLAYYGDSNIGKLKTLYRKGLGHRYGRSMQSIAGVHYNFSLSDSFWEHLKKTENSSLSLREFKDEKYFHLIRNFQRNRWLLVYLFGASPVVDKSFLVGKEHKLKPLDDESFYTPTGTSLRMGGLGYTSSAQSEIGICYNQVSTYIKTLENARLKSFVPYEKIGFKKDGVLNQLNTNLLQIDNEFYSTIRPKNVANSKESALKALHKRGIEYIEVRLIDVDPFSPLGISSDTVNFLHLFLLWCLTSESPKISDNECSEIDFNFNQVVLKGRSDSFMLKTHGKEVNGKEYIKEVMGEIDSFSQEIKKVEPQYVEALNTQWEKIKDPAKLPSERVLNLIKKSSYIKDGLEKSVDYSKTYLIEEQQEEKFNEFRLESQNEQKRIEENDKLDFEDFLKKYFEEIKINF